MNASNQLETFDYTEPFALAIVLLPLCSAIISGLWGNTIGKRNTSILAIVSIGISFILSLEELNWIRHLDFSFSANMYEWGKLNGIPLSIGFMLDRLSVLMMVVVTFVSLMVHIYSIGYMRDDPGYQRFFSYISLFTFGMLMLVMSNNFLQLFFGWEMVGLMSYLLIGFWFQRESANRASLKAFLVNRIGDFGFILGIAAVYSLFGSLDYLEVFGKTSILAGEPPHEMFGLNVMDLICLLLFIGAMGKSAQIPLHVWLPDSMEGPTPISALIHAATMVTAGVFMLARMSPLFEYSDLALNVVLIIGALTALLMGILGLVQNDIKRIIAYSTLSQLGYMMTAMGASAYGIGIFHLMTHAFFKALLFLGAGSVIIALHHEQNIWKMGQLRRSMPITYATMLIGSLALIGFPGFSGFFSKDLIIEAVHQSEQPAAAFAYYAVLGSVLITALYSFRLLFVVFHGQDRIEAKHKAHLHESPASIIIPLMLLAIPSIVAGWAFITPLFEGYFNHSIFIRSVHTTMEHLSSEFKGAVPMLIHGLYSIPFFLALAGIFMAWYLYIYSPLLPALLQSHFKRLYGILREKYGFDRLYHWLATHVINGIGWLCWRLGDEWLIDEVLVNGTAETVGRAAKKLKYLQSGYLYDYALAMITGFILLTGWVLWY